MAGLASVARDAAGRWRRHEKLRFLVVGGWNTLFGYVTFLALYAALHERVHYLVIGVLAHAIATVNAFACHRLLVFRSRGPLFAEFVRFVVSQLALLAGALVALWVLVSLLQLHPLVGQAIVTVGVVVAGYLAHRRFTFAG